MRALTTPGVAIVVLLLNAIAAAPSIALSAECGPSADNPVGWRGDGTGRYPEADPSTSWERKQGDAGHQPRGIRWMSPMPNIGVSSPIVVGDRIYLTAEPCDLVCVEKRTGRVLWIRSSAEFEGISPEERASTPAYSPLEQLMKDLALINGEVVTSLNALLPTAMTTLTPQRPDEAVKRKRDIEKQVLKAQQTIDKKKFARYWGQEVFGFSGATAVSDGKHVCVFYTTGLAACYDLDGNRKWIAHGSGGGSEHGNFASPILCDGKLIVWANEMRAYDVETGKLVWSMPAKAFNTYGSMFRVRAAGEWIACFQWGFFARARDGKPVWEQGVFGDSVQTPIVEGDTIYAAVGYPKANDQTKGLRAFKIPTTLDPSVKLVAARQYVPKWADDEIPVDQKKAPFIRGYVASPLYVDGLIYQLTQGGGLTVHDAASGELAYRKALDLKPKTEYWNWAGCATSPTLAGKYIYLSDNQGMTIVIKPGRAYVEVARNVIQEAYGNDKQQAQFLATPVFEGKQMYHRTPGYLYCVGE